MKREVNIGGVKIGGKNRVAVQSMCNTDTRDAKATVEQIKRLEDAGCEIVRVAVPDMAAAAAVAEIKKNISVPLVADIHFDYRLVDMAKERGVPIRIGVNGGSLDKRLLEKHGGVTVDALVESAMEHVAILDELNFFDTVVSIKVSNVPVMLDAYRKFDKISDIPLHVGVTEAGTVRSGTIKSAVGIGALLSEGIGDTIRVSLTADPVEEIYAAYDILKVLGMRKQGAELVSCPTCGRTQIDLIRIAEEVEKRISNIQKPIKVAVMGCAVNGPGEAREADIGIAGGKGEGLIFKRGEILRKVPQDKLAEEINVKKYLVINGANLNMLGIREPGIYGSGTLSELEERLTKKAGELNVGVDFFQSNFEGEIIEKIHSAMGVYDGIIINPGAFTHYSYAIRDAFGSIKTDAIEVHISNIHKREEFRHTSVIVPECIGQICGLGFKGYELALEFLAAKEDGKND